MRIEVLLCIVYCSSLYSLLVSDEWKRLAGISALSTKIVGVGFEKCDLQAVLDINKRAGRYSL